MPLEGLTLPLDWHDPTPRNTVLDAGAILLGQFARQQDVALLEALADVLKVSPFRQMVTPGGWKMSVAMTNCGDVGWVTDRTGYRYDPKDPTTGQRWPKLPTIFAFLARRAAEAAGFAGLEPDACLINRYQAGTRLSLHRDSNENNFSQPIVSVSLGLPATFLWGGQARTDRPRRVPLLHGDVVVWGGPARLTYHGVHHLADGRHPMTGDVRYNLTLRKAL
jgi:alkylated DNA repair protein (DNA oxidative demethylase)